MQYFSAYATWLPGQYQRHQTFVAALQASGVVARMANFKEKDRLCKTCGSRWKGHEEKESDVDIAVQLIAGAIDDEYDQAFLLSGDSDLAAPLRFVRSRFPEKRIKVIAAPGRHHSKELWSLATHRAAIQRVHVEKCLFPREVYRADGSLAATRPKEYDPPQPAAGS